MYDAYCYVQCNTTKKSIQGEDVVKKKNYR